MDIWGFSVSGESEHEGVRGWSALSFPHLRQQLLPLTLVFCF